MTPRHHERVFETTFTSSTAYDSPFLDVEVDEIGRAHV